jgi:hypothetical protein
MGTDKEGSVPASQSAIRRLCLAVDVESYSRRSRPEQLDVQNRLLWTMVQACRAASVDPAGCDRQDSGDGQILLLPGGADESKVLPGIVLGLLTALHRVNHPAGTGGRVRLRVSVGQGAIQIGATGFVAPAVVTVCRLLDSDELRSALSGSPAGDAAFAVTEDLYHDMFAHGYGGLPPQGFRPVQISRPAKGFSAEAWIQAPGALPLLSSVPPYPGPLAAELGRRQRSGGVALAAVGGSSALAWAVFAVGHRDHATHGSPLDYHEEPGGPLDPGHGAAGHAGPDADSADGGTDHGHVDQDGAGHVTQDHDESLSLISDEHLWLATEHETSWHAEIDDPFGVTDSSDSDAASDSSSDYGDY